MEQTRQTSLNGQALPRWRQVTVRGLIVPCDPARHCRTVELALTAVALSDAIGGGLLDEGLVGEYQHARYSVYLDEARVERGMPPNDRAAILSARLGMIDRQWLADVRGDALFLGWEAADDTDVPAVVLHVARQSGLLAGGNHET